MSGWAELFDELSRDTDKRGNHRQTGGGTSDCHRLSRLSQGDDGTCASPGMPAEAHVEVEADDIRPSDDGFEERAAIVRLRTGAKQVARSPDWWRDEYEERAAIREFDGRYTRAEAQRLAWGELENRWHSEYGERVPVDICAGCRRPIGQTHALDVADGTRVHGADCLIEFGKRWRGAATRALAQMGLTPPEGA